MLLKLEKTTKSYSKDRTILDQLDLEVNAGERIAIIKILFWVLLLINQNVYCQQSKMDSLAVKFIGAVKLCDSINTPLSDTIRFTIIKYLKQNGFNPKEFYTTKFSFRKTTDEGFVGLLKIGALRDLYNWRFSKEIRVDSSGGVKDGIYVLRVGSSGGVGDEIVVVFDNSFRNIKRISPSE